MVQVEIFSEKTFGLDSLKNKVNDFLKENDGKIEVKDIKYTIETPNPGNHNWMIWTVMVVYELK